MRKRLYLISGLCLTLGLAASTAHAGAIIDFSGGVGAGGTLSFNGLVGGTLKGSNILIDRVSGNGTPANDGVAANVTGNDLGGPLGSPVNPGCKDTPIGSPTTRNCYGVLDFETGAYQEYSNGAYHFGSGGFFTIHGNVLAAGIDCPTNPLTCQDTHPVPGGANGALLLNGVVGVTVVSNTFIMSNSSFVQYGGTDAKHDMLEAFFGLGADTLYIFNGFTIQMGGAVGTGGAFTRTANSTDINNEVVPEPASLLLLGSGLTVLGTVIRRRKSPKPAQQG